MLSLGVCLEERSPLLSSCKLLKPGSCPPPNPLDEVRECLQRLLAAESAVVFVHKHASWLDSPWSGRIENPPESTTLVCVF